MSEREAKKTKTREEDGKSRRKIESVHEKLEESATFIPDDNRQSINDPVMQLPALMNKAVQGAQVVEAMLTLQQSHGNRHVQRLVESSGTGTLNNTLTDRIEAQKGSGKKLDPKVRSRMEKSFGAGLSKVEIHVDGEADELSSELRANAFTSGNDVFFRAGSYNPNTEEGIRTLRHELTHVMQQSGALSAKPGQLTRTGDTAETEAKNAEISSKPVISTHLSPAMVARQGHATPESPKQPGEEEPVKKEQEESEEESLRETLKAMWTGTVLGPVTMAEDALGAGKLDKPTALKVVGHISTALSSIASIQGRYAAKKPAISIAMQRDGNTLIAVKAGLQPVINKTIDIEWFQNALNGAHTGLISTMDGL